MSSAPAKAAETLPVRLMVEFPPAVWASILDGAWAARQVPEDYVASLFGIRNQYRLDGTITVSRPAPIKESLC